MAEAAYINGEFFPISEAVVSIDDRGYQFGDGVYEVVYGLAGRPFLLKEHMDRLANSLDGLAIRGVDFSRVEEVIKDLAGRVLPKSKVYLSITRGVAPRDHLFPPGVSPNVVATVRAVPNPPPDYLEKGVKAVTATDIRWGRCDLKTLNILGNVLCRQQAEEKGAQEAILVGPDGLVREGTSTNCFAVFSGVLYTHPLNERILPGITRSLILDLARENGIRVVEEAVSLERFREADEIFITGTVAELVAVTKLDDRPVGDGVPGRLTREIRVAYDSRVRDFIGEKGG